MAKYSELFSIQYRHEYYTKAGHLNMSCVPSKATHRLLYNMGVILRTNDGGCSLYFDEELYAGSKNLYALFPDEEITFFLFPQDGQSFYNYTRNIKTDDEGVLVFSTDTAKKRKAGIIDLGFGQYQKFFPVEKDKPDGLRKTNGSTSLNADEIYELRTRANALVPLVFKINTTQLLKYAKSNQYQINFSSLDTYYKYYLCNDLNGEKLELIDVDKTIKFVRVKQEQLNNGKLAEVFLSTDPVKSFYKAQRHFQLMDGSSGSARIIMDYMPLPAPGKFYKDQINGNNVIVSEIFIN